MAWRQATSNAEHCVYTTWCIEVAWTADDLKRLPVLVGGGAAYIFPKFPVLLWEKWADSWLSDFTAFVPGCVLGEQTKVLLWAALEEKRNGVTPSGQGGKPWIMLNESEPESRIRVSQWVTRRWGCLLLWVQGKFSCIALGKLEKWGWGRKKSLRVGTDERTGERVKLVGRRSPKDRDHRGELPGKGERQRSLGTRLIDMKGSLSSLYDFIISANAFVFKAPQPTLDEE